jgi:hypothetical protein
MAEDEAPGGDGLNAHGAGLVGVERIRAEVLARHAAVRADAAERVAAQKRQAVAGILVAHRGMQDRLEAERRLAMAALTAATRAGETWQRRLQLLAPIVDWLQALTPVFVGLTETANSLLRLVTPENVRDLGAEEWARLVAISAEQRMGLLWAPRAQVLQALLAAEDVAARGRVVEDAVDVIVADCAASLALVTDPQVAELAAFARSAIRAHQAGHVEAAQALATNVLDSGLSQFGEDPKVVLRTAREWGSLDDEDWVSLRVYRTRLAAAGIPTAYRGVKSGSGDGRYSRHGTTHLVSRALYTPGNSARAISLAVTWLRLVQETARHGVGWHGEPLVVEKP